MYLVPVIVLALFTEVELVNKGRLRGVFTGDLPVWGRRKLKTQRKEIAYGDIVDYSSLKRNYPFISRLLFDDLRCGGALISDRYLLRNTLLRVSIQILKSETIVEIKSCVIQVCGNC